MKTEMQSELQTKLHEDEQLLRAHKYAEAVSRIDELEVAMSEISEGMEVVIPNLIDCLNHPNAPEHKYWRDIVLLALARMQELSVETMGVDSED